MFNSYLIGARTAQYVRRQGTVCTARAHLTTCVRDLALLHSVQIDTTSYEMSTRDSFPGI
jgi:hypothetical protein